MVTVLHEGGEELVWRAVRELVVGRVRATPQPPEDTSQDVVLSLSVLPPCYIEQPDDKRYGLLLLLLRLRSCAHFPALVLG